MVNETVQAVPLNQPLAAAIPSPRRDILWLLAGCLGLWGWTYGLWDLWGPDETRYVQVAKELLTRHNWLLLTVNYEPYDQKPPLPFWMIAAMLKLGGGAINCWTVRLPSVLFGTLTILLTYWIGRRRFGRSIGWLAAWILMTAPLMIVETPSARLDIPLTGWVTLAMAAWLARAPDEPPPPGRAFLFWIAVIGAFFTKGPISLLIIWGTVGLEAWRERSWRPLRELRAWAGVPVFLALVALWLAAQRANTSANFVEGQLKSELWNRITSTRLHYEPWYKFDYFIELFGDGLAVWGVLLALALRGIWRARNHPDPLRPARRPLLLWALFPFVVLSIIPGKREQYLLPLYPAMALLAAWFIDRRLFTRPLPRRARHVAAAVAFSGGAISLIVAIYWMFQPAMAHQLEWRPTTFALTVGAAVGLAGVAIAALWLRARDWWRAFGLTVAMLYAGGVLVLGATHPAMSDSRSTRGLSRAANQYLALPDGTVGAITEAFKPRFQVYGAYRMAWLDDDPDKIAARHGRLPSVILSEPDDWEDVEKVMAPLGYRRVYKASKALDRIGVYVRFDPLTASPK